MDFKLNKTLLAGSFVALGIFGLSACGGDSSSSADDPNTPSQYEGPTAQDAIIKTSGLGINSSIGDVVEFKGLFQFDYKDTTTQDAEALKFDSLSFNVGVGASLEGLQILNVAVSHDPIPATPKPIQLYDYTVAVNLSDAGFTTCGEFNLVVTAYGSDGTNTFSTTQLIPFTRADKYCAVVESSSSAQVPEDNSNEISLTPCEVSLSTNIYPGVDLANCQPVAAADAEASADIIFKAYRNEGEFEMKGVSNKQTKLSPISNTEYETYAEYWPEVVNNRNAWVSDSKYRQLTTNDLDEMLTNSSSIYVATTASYVEGSGTGFYAFGVQSYSEEDNGVFNFTLKIYRYVP